MSELEKTIKDYIKPPEINDRYKASVEGCCVLCGYPLDKDLWDKKKKPLFSAIRTLLHKKVGKKKKIPGTFPITDPYLPYKMEGENKIIDQMHKEIDKL